MAQIAAAASVAFARLSMAAMRLDYASKGRLCKPFLGCRPNDGQWFIDSSSPQVSSLTLDNIYLLNEKLKV